TCVLSTLFLFSFDGVHRDLHSFPTRRSSDLSLQVVSRPWRPLGRSPICARADADSVRCERRPTGIRSSSCSGTGTRDDGPTGSRSEEHTSELQSRFDLVCRLLLEKKNTMTLR